LLRFEKSRVLLIELGLVKLLKPMQDLLERFGRVNVDCPGTIADDELMHGLVAMNLALACTQATEESFQGVVGTIAFRPSVAREESRPALPEGGTEVGDHPGIFRMALGMLLQLGQEVLDVVLDEASCRARLTRFIGWVEPSIQLDQPIALAAELPVLSREGSASLNHGQQLIQERMAPFFRLCWSEASKRVRSSNTRRPPRTKGGLLPSVSVIRINSA
jgi:hypothetical protein